MPAANYKKTSPYTDTEVYSFFLDVANIPDIPKTLVMYNTKLIISINIDPTYWPMTCMVIVLFGGLFLLEILTYYKIQYMTSCQEQRYTFQKRKL